MDPVQTAALVKAAEASVDIGEDAARGFLSKVVGPAAEEVGLLLQDKVRLYRFNNQVKAVSKAGRMVKDAGLEPETVPLRTLLPLLDGAALEDDLGLSDKWAALLANAAAPNDVGVPPSFPVLLSQMSPSEAAILDTLYQRTKSLDPKSGIRIDGGLIERIGLSKVDFDLAFDNLERLNLLQGAGKLGENKETGMPSVSLEIRGREAMFITHLGRSFCSACTPPARAA